MAFTTNVKRSNGALAPAYNVDFSVGAGAPGNRPTDIALVQALFKFAYFDLDPPVAPPPPTDKSIAVDGVFGSATRRFILHFQSQARGFGQKMLLDGICDPFRGQGESSHIAHVRYALELLNNGCANTAHNQGRLAEFEEFAKRPDLPPGLRAELNGPRRTVALKYAA
jgi:hypothetical protein